MHVCRLGGALDSALGLERLFIADLNLASAVLPSFKHVSVSLNVFVTKGVVAWFTEEDRVDTWAFLNRLGPDVGWIDDDFLGVFSILVNAGYYS